MQRVNQVLVEGGLIKAVFRGRDASPDLKEKRAGLFAESLRKLGYFVAVKNIMVGNKKEGELLLARKPYQNPEEDTWFDLPENILEQDEFLMRAEIEVLKEERPNKTSSAEPEDLTQSS